MAGVGRHEEKEEMSTHRKRCNTAPSASPAISFPFIPQLKRVVVANLMQHYGFKDLP
jgi:hypothetical protein